MLCLHGRGVVCHECHDTISRLCADLNESNDEIARLRAERDESLPMSIGTAVLRALEPMDESEELTRADRIDYIARSHGEDSWTHDVLRAIAGALRAHAAGSGAGDRFRARAAAADHAEVPVLAAEASEPSPPPTAPPLLEWGPDGPRLSEYERKRLEREEAEASWGVCDRPSGEVVETLRRVLSAHIGADAVSLQNARMRERLGDPCGCSVEYAEKRLRQTEEALAWLAVIETAKVPL